MKKRFLAIIATMLALFLTVFASGCDACAGDTTLYFSNNFYKGGASQPPSSEYREDFYYTVEFIDKYETIQKDSLLKNQEVDYNFSGTYEMHFTANANTQNLNTSVEIPENASIYALTTKLNLNAWYKVSGTYADGGEDFNDGKTYKDVLESTIYFLPAGYGFAPLYSVTKQTYTSLYFVKDKFDVKRTEYNVETIYENSSYNTNVSGSLDRSFTGEYKFKSSIDNAELLFTLRSFEIEEERTKKISVISPAYNAPQSLIVRNEREYTETFALDNNEPIGIPVKKYSMYRDDRFNMGITQYFTIQKVSEETPNEKALLLEYISPLCTNGSTYTMGAIKYTLDKTTNQA